MSTDLKIQIRNLARTVETGQDPITVDEVCLLVEGRDDTEPLIGPAPDRRLVLTRRPWPAVIAAVVVLLVFGAVAWMLPSDEPLPPADPFPPGSESAFYTTSAVPDGFVLQDIRNIGDSQLFFLREFEGTWLPTNGGFAIHGVLGRAFGLPEDPAGYLEETHAAVPGSERVQVDGSPGILHEIEVSQDDLTFPLVLVLAVDDRGGVFEVVAVGMSRDEVIAVANGVHRVPVEDFVELGSHIEWDVRITTVQSGFGYSPPSRVTNLAEDIDAVLGFDLLMSRLAHAGQQDTVITTQDGEVVETFGRAIRANSAALYLDVPEDGLDAALSAYPGIAELSPPQRDLRVDRYVDRLRGPVVSEDPYVMQAAPGPEPQFDVDGLGEELPLVPATSADVLPEYMFAGPSGDRPAATEERPVIVMGTVQQPNSDTPPVTILVYFTETGVICVGTATDNGMGTGCGFEILSRFGVDGISTGESDDGVVSGEMSYVVPLETSVVQIVTPSQSYRQEPIGGYGVVPFGETVERPTTIVAYDADGDEIDRWRVGGS